MGKTIIFIAVLLLPASLSSQSNMNTRTKGIFNSLLKFGEFLNPNLNPNLNLNLNPNLSNSSVLDIANTCVAACLWSKSVYYYKVEDYEKALLHLNKMDEMGVETDATTQMSINIARSHVLHKLNRDREAYELMEKIVKMKDSLDYKRFLLQFSELQTRYEVNTIKTEKELQSAQLERTEAIAFGLVGISLSFLTLIVITRRNKKNREKRNRIIYGQYEQMKSYLDQIRTQRHEQEISRQEKKKESVNWAERATCYLVETEMFKVNDLSRDDLAIALGTNRQYLINAIKEETGKTFKDYINTIRIEYAYDMLVKDWTASIESIYLEAGFSTRSTFNRLFKQRYGFSPVEMREVVMQKEEYLMLQAEKLKSGN